MNHCSKDYSHHTYISALLLLLIILLFRLFYGSKMQFCSWNNKLEQVSDFAYPGDVNVAELSHPVVVDGCFQNPFKEWVQPAFTTLLKWKTMKAPKTNWPKFPEKEQVDEHMPLKQPQFASKQGDDALSVTWIGHATCVVEADGVAAITDPIFSDHCAPSLINRLGSTFLGSYFTSSLRRYLAPPCKVSDLPDTLRFVMISHSHYDHCDAASCLEIANKFGSRIVWCVPLGLKKTMQRILPEFCHESIYEFDWWQGREFRFSPSNKTFKVVATPAQHWSQRVTESTNSTLWSSWVWMTPSSKRFFFAGDTGYCAAFKEIGRVFGPFDVAAIPIGACVPREIMKPQHVNPAEAVLIHDDIRSKVSFGIHYGTFPMADEGFLDPQDELLELAGWPQGRNPVELKDCPNQISLTEAIRQANLKLSFVTLHCGQTYRV